MLGEVESKAQEERHYVDWKPADRAMVYIRRTGRREFQ